MTTNNTRIFLISVALVALAVTVRLLSHDGTLPPNFGAVAAVALFAGAFLPLGWAVGVPLAAMLISDLFIPGDVWAMTVTVYALLAAPALIGRLVKRSGSKGVARAVLVTGSAIGASVLFFVGSNLAVWAFNDYYPATASGLGACFVAALPFFKYTLAGDLVFAGALFGLASLAPRVLPTPAPTVARV